MNRKLIFKAISDIDDFFIAESMVPPVAKADHPPERTSKMGKFENTRKGVHSRRLISLILAACLVVTLAITAYAAIRAFGLLDYLTQRGMKDGQAVEELLVTPSELHEEAFSAPTSDDNMAAEDGTVYYSTKYAKYTILEAVCDSQTIYLSSQVVPLGDYFLIPQYLTSEDSVSNLFGMESLFENNPDMTISEYVSTQGKTLAYAGIGYRTDLEAEGRPLTGGEEHRYDVDGTLYFYHTAQNIWDSKEFTMKCTGNGYDPGASLEEIERVSFEVKVRDKSTSSKDTVYTNFDPKAKTETGIQINSLAIEETEIGLYATFHYSIAEAKFDGIFFKIVDGSGMELTNLPGTSGTGEIDNGDGTFSCTVNYQKPDSMEGLQFAIRDVWNSVNYGPYSFE